MVYADPNFTRPNDMLVYVNDVTNGLGFGILLVVIFVVALFSLMSRGNNFARASLGAIFLTSIMAGIFLFLKVIEIGIVAIVIVILLGIIVLNYVKRGEF